MVFGLPPGPLGKRAHQFNKYDGPWGTYARHQIWLKLVQRFLRKVEISNNVMNYKNNNNKNEKYKKKEIINKQKARKNIIKQEHSQSADLRQATSVSKPPQSPYANLINCSLYECWPILKISSRSVHNFSQEVDYKIRLFDALAGVRAHQSFSKFHQLFLVSMLTYPKNFIKIHS